LEAIALVQTPLGDQLRSACFANARRFRSLLKSSKPGEIEQVTQIQPIIIGGEQQALACSASLRQEGILAPAIRFPTVARGAARLRLAFSAAHTPGQVETLASKLQSVLGERRED
jgi:7-keto-8-aminopelargonate synthetase-like enzyme